VYSTRALESHRILVFCWGNHNGSKGYEKEYGNSPYELLSGLQAGEKFIHIQLPPSRHPSTVNKTTVSTATAMITPSFA
jgi:hypothetical protein